MMGEAKQKLALVVGTVPAVHDIDQFQLLKDTFEVTVVSSESIVGYLTQNSYFQDLTCLALSDYEDNPSYLPGLEKVLEGFDVVMVKERIGLYAYQCVKAKWRHRFRLLVWVDNLTVYPADDVDQMRVVRDEVTNAADGFIVQSHAGAQSLIAEGIEPGRLIEMQPWVQSHVKRTAKTRADARAALHLSESDFVISYFGQIEWEEGLDQLASACKILMSQNESMRDKLKIIFCGIGSYASHLTEFLIKLGIDDIAVYVQPNRQTIEAVIQACDGVYVNSVVSRDRIDGDPYRILTAMNHGVPILAARTPMVEDLCGKHRIDFCQGSIASLAKGIEKLHKAKALVNDIVKKNLATCKQRFSKESVTANMRASLQTLVGLPHSITHANIEHLVMEAEAKVNNKQYLAAIDIIENIFKQKEIPAYHKANLCRLIGDSFTKLGDNEAAKDAYIQSAELDPYSAKVYIGLGTLSLVKNSFDIAVLHFQKAVSLAPEDEMANLGLGLAFHGMDETKEALRWVNKALNYNFENAAAIFTLVKISHELEEFTDASRAINKYLEAHPNDYNMIYTQAGIYYKMARYDEALELTKRITDVDPGDAKAHALLKQINNAINNSRPQAQG